MLRIKDTYCSHLQIRRRSRAHAVSHLGATANDTLSVYSYSGDGVAGSLCLAGCAGHTPPTMR